MPTTALKLLFVGFLTTGISFAQSAKEMNVKLRESLVQQQGVYEAQIKVHDEVLAAQEKIRQENEALYKEDLKKQYVEAYNLIDATTSCTTRLNALGIKTEDTMRLVKIRLNSISEMIALTVNRSENTDRFLPVESEFSMDDIDQLSAKKQNEILGQRIEAAILTNASNLKLLDEQEKRTVELQSFNKHIKGLLEDYKAITENVRVLHASIYSQIVREAERYAKEGLKNIPKEYHEAYKDEFEPREGKSHIGMSWTSEKPLFRIDGEEISEEQPKVLLVVDESAEFPGGTAALLKYITDNIRYSENMKELGIYGKLYLKFVVSGTGDVSNVKVLRGIEDCEECTQEAIRLVQGMPKWIPGKVDGKPVSMYYNLPIRFDAR